MKLLPTLQAMSSYQKVDGTDPAIQRHVSFSADAGSSNALRRRTTQEGRERALRLSQRRSLDGFYHETPIATDEEGAPLNTPGKTMFLLINTMIGAGVLNVPETFAQTGIALGLVLFCVTVWASVLGMVQLVQAADKVGVCDYGELAEKTFGVRGKKFMDFVIFLGGYGALISYFVTVGTLSAALIGRIIGAGPYSSYEFLLTTMTLLVIVPVCMVREFGHLACISVVSVAAIAGVIVLVLVHGPFVGEAAGQAPTTMLWWRMAGMNKLGSITFALGCAHSTFHAYRSIEPKAAWSRTVLGATCVGALMCVVTGLAGYLSFGTSVKAEILDSFPDSDVVATPLKFLVILHLLFYIPIDFVILRHSLVRIWDTDTLDLPNSTYAALTFGLVGSCLLLVMFMRDFGVILDLTGGLTGSLINFIFPAMAYLRTHSDEEEGRLQARALLVFGVIVMLASVVLTIVNAMK